jgi:NitT/TauT family transport system ATP-binding protein
MVTVRDISKSYATSRRGRLVAIEQVSLEVSEGEFVSIIGHSGCGKTTLLKIIAGLVRPTEGTVYAEGHEVKSPLRDIGIVFQNPMLMPWRTVMANVLLPIELLGRRTDEYRERALELLRILGLDGFHELYPRELSGGMQQRAAIARALIHDPAILLLDEPFGSLDELTREQMGIELLRMTEKMRKTVVFVTHSVPEAVMLADRVVVLSPRPATVKMDLEISNPRPRDGSIRTDAAYIGYCETVRRALGVSY